MFIGISLALTQSSGGGAEAPAPYFANAVEFDGANDYLRRTNIIHGSASSTGSISFWVRLDADTEGSDYYEVIQGSVNGVSDELLSVIFGVVEQQFFVTMNNYDIFAVTTPNISLPTGWLNFLASWEIDAGQNFKTFHVYINDTIALDSVSDDVNESTIAYNTLNHWMVGEYFDGTFKLNGGLADLYFAPGQFLDFSVQANRRKFIDAAGKPVSLGADGSTPTGSTPAIYLKGDHTNFEVNSGTGGNFTVTGALTAAPTSPSD